MPFGEVVDLGDLNMEDALNNPRTFSLKRSNKIIKDILNSSRVRYIDRKIGHGGGTKKSNGTLQDFDNTVHESNDDNVEIVDSRLEKAIQWAKNIANNNSIGYKYGGGGNGGYDCSHFVTAAIKEGGFDVPVTGGGAMKKNLQKVGFTEMPYPGPEKLKPGDVVREVGRHVELYAGNNKIIGAHSDKDKKPGDSSKEEISVRDAKKSLQRRSPNRILRYTGEVMT